PILHTAENSAHEAERIEAGVLKEMLVLRGEHRVDHDLGDIVEMNDAPFLAAAVEEIGHQFGFEGVLSTLGGVPQRDNLCDFPATDLEDRAFRVVSVGARVDFNRVRTHAVPPDPVRARLAIPAPPNVRG